MVDRHDRGYRIHEHSLSTLQGLRCLLSHKRKCLLNEESQALKILRLVIDETEDADSDETEDADSDDDDHDDHENDIEDPETEVEEQE